MAVRKCEEAAVGHPRGTLCQRHPGVLSCVRAGGSRYGVGLYKVAPREGLKPGTQHLTNVEMDWTLGVRSNTVGLDKRAQLEKRGGS